MIVTLKTERISTLDQVRAFLDGNESADCALAEQGLGLHLRRPHARVVRLPPPPGKPGKGLLKAYITKDSGLSRALRDPRNGEVRGALRGSAAMARAAGAAGPGAAPLEVLVSRGIPDAEAWRR